MIGFSVLADAAFKGSVALAMAAGVAWSLRRRSAAARHLVWTAAAAALLALPLLSVTLPALRVPARTSGAVAFFRVFSSGRVTVSAPQHAPAAEARTGSAHPTVEIDFGWWAVAIWGAGASIGLLQMVVACFALRRLRRGSRPLDCGGLPEAVGVGRVDVLEATGQVMPMTFGVFRPTVLLPAAASDWDGERLRMVLLHELAHVRRGDVATHLMARTALALYWWNPLAWFGWREFLKERERATDDLVLEAGERASSYAGHLLDIARGLQTTRATAWAAIAMARRSELEGRLVAILDSGVTRKVAGRWAPFIAAGAAIAIIAPFAAVRAQDPVIPREADATVRLANSQRNHDMLDRAAAAYENLSRYDVAQKLLENSLAIREQVSGNSSAAYAAGLVKLGDLAVKRRQPDEALAFYSKAVSLGDRPETAPALLYLGTRAWEQGDVAAAEDLFQRVLRVESRGVNAGRALVRLALLRQKTPGGASEAELLYQKALAALDPQTAETVATLHSYANLLHGLNRGGEAEQLEDRATQVQMALNKAAGEPPPGVYRVGNGVSAPRLLSKVEPEYTEEARKAKYQGVVLLYCEVNPDGMARKIRVIRSLGFGLDEKAMDAISRWRFQPGIKDGLPVTVAATIEVNFRLL